MKERCHCKPGKSSQIHCRCAIRTAGQNRPKRKPQKRTKRKSPKTASVTISIGVAEAGPNLTKPTEVIKAADRALYRAKKKGRNCVVA
ncbi:MAG: diguanylate cyclase [Desulfocapsa sp.]|nr:diguanylate cyclase [Desulfocapsa sp.]